MMSYSHNGDKNISKHYLDLCAIISHWNVYKHERFLIRMHLLALNTAHR